MVLCKFPTVLKFGFASIDNHGLASFVLFGTFDVSTLNSTDKSRDPIYRDEPNVIGLMNISPPFVASIWQRCNSCILSIWNKSSFLNFLQTIRGCPLVLVKCLLTKKMVYGTGCGHQVCKIMELLFKFRLMMIMTSVRDNNLIRMPAIGKCLKFPLNRDF